MVKSNETTNDTHTNIGNYNGVEPTRIKKNVIKWAGPCSSIIIRHINKQQPCEIGIFRIQRGDGGVVVVL